VTSKPVARRVPVHPGDLVRLGEADYRYGRGDLTMRITRIRTDISQWPDREWIWLEGIPIRWDGSEDQTRTVLARASALRPRHH
jgi:hypothetical protein